MSGATAFYTIFGTLLLSVLAWCGVDAAISAIEKHKPSSEVLSLILVLPVTVSIVVLTITAWMWR